MKASRASPAARIRGLAIILGGAAILSLLLSLTRAQSSKLGALAEQVLFGVMAVVSVLMLAQCVQRYLRRDSTNRASQLEAHGGLCWALGFLLLFLPLFVRSVALTVLPSWASALLSGASILCIVVGFALRLAAKRQGPPSSEQGESPRS